MKKWVNPYKKMTKQELCKLEKELSGLDGMAAASSLQCPMGYDDNQDYIKLMMIRDELKRRKDDKR